MKRIYMVTVVSSRQVLVVQEEADDFATGGTLAKVAALKFLNNGKEETTEDNVMLVSHEQDTSATKLHP